MTLGEAVLGGAVILGVIIAVIVLLGSIVAAASTVDDAMEYGPWGWDATFSVAWLLIVLLAITSFIYWAAS